MGKTEILAALFIGIAIGWILTKYVKIEFVKPIAIIQAPSSTKEVLTQE